MKGTTCPELITSTKSRSAKRSNGRTNQRAEGYAQKAFSSSHQKTHGRNAEADERGQDLHTGPQECHEESRKMKKKKPGLYANIHAKRKRIAAGSKERMRKPGSKGAPTAKAFRQSAKTAKKK